MDTSSEYQEAPSAPQTESERIAEISRLINDTNDADRGQEGNPGAGESAQAADDEPSGSGPGPVGEPESDGAGDVHDDPETDQAAAAEDADGPVTLKRLAEHLDIEDAELYELEVPITGDEAVSLGELKDNWKQYGPAQEYQKQLHDERQNFEKQVLQTRAELNEIMNLIPETVRGDIIAKARNRQQHFVKEQETAVLEAIPEWQDADQRAKDRANLVEDGAEYGFSEQEITYTQDARTLRMLRDFSVMKRELASLKAAAKKQPGKASRPGKAASTSKRTRLSQLVQKGKQASTMQTKQAVVSELLRNQ